MYSLSGARKEGEVQMEENLRNFAEHTQEREGPRLKTACPPQAVSFYTHPSLMTSSPAHHRSKPWTMENCMPNTPAACVFTALLLENDEAV